MEIRPITGLTPAREQAYQERVMLSIARMSEPAIKRELKRAYRDIAINGADAMEAHEIRMNTILSSLYSKAFDKLGRRLWNSAKKSKQGFEVKRDVPLTPQFDLARQLWIRSVAAEKVTQIAGTTKEQAEKLIQDALSEAVELGLDERQTAALIQTYINREGGALSRLRSRVISRTESHSASSASQQMAAKASGLPMVKEWVASWGERTREEHQIASGQSVPIDEPFIVGGESLMQPGDPNGSAGNIINCRCAAVYGLG